MADGSIRLSRTGFGRLMPRQDQRTIPPLVIGLFLDNHGGPITAMKFLGSTDTLATTSTDGVVKIWERNLGLKWTSADVLRTYEGRTDEGAVLAFASISDRAAILAVGGGSGVIHLWKLNMNDYSVMSFHKIQAPATLNHAAGQAKRVHFLEIDAGNSSLLVQYGTHPCFYRYDVLDRLASKVTVFGHAEGFIGSITALAVDFSANDIPLRQVPTHSNGGGTALESPDPESSYKAENNNLPSTFDGMAYVVAGDDQGRTFAWDWNAVSSGGGAIRPVRQLQGFEAKVTAVGIDELLVLIGT